MRANPSRPAQNSGPIASAWGREAADTVVRRFATAAERDADFADILPADLEGQLIAIVPAAPALPYLQQYRAGAWADLHAGALVSRHFPFDYQTPNLANGAALYTPTPGDLIHDLWIEITTPWNGATPKADVGTFVGGPTDGWFFFAGPLDLTQADDAPAGDGWIANSGSFASPSLMTASAGYGAARIGAPGRFTAANPLKVVVSTTGSIGGGAAGATQGTAVLYLVTSTPI